MFNRSIARSCVALSLLALSLAARPARAARPSGYVPGEVLVGVKATSSNPFGGVTGSLKNLFGALGQVAGGHPKLKTYRLKLRRGETVEHAVSRLRGSGEVAFAEPNHIRHKLSTPNDPNFSRQYALTLTKATQAWDAWQPQSQVVVAIVDTGIDYNHPDLTDVIYRDSSHQVIGYNATGSGTDPLDDEGHGSHCSGITAGHINNGVGIAGVAGWNPLVPASDQYIKLMPVKVLDSDGSGSDASVADGIIWAADHGAKVISMSLGGPGASRTLDDAVQYAWNAGCVIVAAAGNESTNEYSYPAATAHVISVAATDRNDQLTYYSNYGSWVLTAAPGEDIYSTFKNGGYASESGTSMATPLVAGEAAAILAQNPDLTNAQVNNLIIGNVDGYTPYKGEALAPGAGRVNVLKALQAASVGTPSTGLSAVAANPSSITGGATTAVTVTLATAAPAGGVTVGLSSNSSYVTVPAQVSIAAGATSGSATVSTQQVHSVTRVTLTASLAGVLKTTTLTLQPITVQSVLLNASTLVGGTPTTGTVTLGASAPAGGVSVSLTTSTSALHLPVAVTVPAGSTTASFNVTTSLVSASTSAQVNATVGSSSNYARLTLIPLLNGISTEALSAKSRRTLVGAITLNGPAPAGGVTVSLTSSKPKLAAVPATVQIAEGETSISFAVTIGKVVRKTTLTLTAQLNDTKSTTKLTVRK